MNLRFPSLYSHPSSIHNQLNMSDICNNMVEMALDLQSMDLDLLEVERKMQTLQLESDTRESELERMVRCSSCLKLPWTCPILNCPSGHLICSSCYRGWASPCPLCRMRMGKTVSLVAEAVISTLELPCNNCGCNARLGVHEMKKHEERCLFRMVACPASCCGALVQAEHFLLFSCPQTAL